MFNERQLINQLMNYHRDKVDEITSPAERLESIPFHLAAVELLARLDDKQTREREQANEVV